VRTPLQPYQLIDSLTGGVRYLPSLLFINKVDLASQETIVKLQERYKAYNPRLIAAVKNIGIDALKENIYNTLKFIRVYLKPQGSKADLIEPMVVKKGTDVEAICNNIHRDFTRNFRYSRVWGPSSKFPGQKVGLNHLLADKDVVSIVIRR